MIELSRYFENIFDDKNITPFRLQDFAEDHLAKLKTDNPAGIYNTIISLTEPVVQGFRSSLNSVEGDTSTRKGGVINKRKARAALLQYIIQKEGGIRDVFGRKSAEYKECLPRGTTAYRRATNAMLEEMTAALLAKQSKFSAALGSAFFTGLSALRNSFINKGQDLNTEKGQVAGSKSGRHNARTALELQLCANICTIAIANMGKPDMADAYFSRHLLFPAKRHHLFKAKVSGGQSKEVCKFKYSEGKRFHIMVTGVEPLRFQMLLNGIAVGREVTIKPREKFNEAFSHFSSAGDALQVTNPGSNAGSYMVWEIT